MAQCAEIWMVHLIPNPFNHSGKTLKQWLLLSEPLICRMVQ